WAAKLDRTNGVLSQAVRCPECGSMRIEYPQFSRRTIMGALPSALAAAGVIERDFYCEACHFTWPAEPPKPGPNLDSLWWSKKDATVQRTFPGSYRRAFPGVSDPRVAKACGPFAL